MSYLIGNVRESLGIINYNRQRTDKLSRPEHTAVVLAVQSAKFMLEDAVGVLYLKRIA